MALVLCGACPHVRVLMRPVFESHTRMPSFSVTKWRLPSALHFFPRERRVPQRTRLDGNKRVCEREREKGSAIAMLEGTQDSAECEVDSNSRAEPYVAGNWPSNSVEKADSMLFIAVDDGAVAMIPTFVRQIGCIASIPIPSERGYHWTEPSGTATRGGVFLQEDNASGQSWM